MEEGIGEGDEGERNGRGKREKCSEGRKREKRIQLYIFTAQHLSQQKGQES